MLEQKLLILQKYAVQMREKQENFDEATTKNSLILPMLQILGHNIYDVNEFVLEMVADNRSNGQEKVDYAILYQYNPVIMIEAKRLNEDLIKHRGQLRRYFNSSINTKAGILTNGVIYEFFSDFQHENIMDDVPFYTFNLLNFTEQDINMLNNFTKCNLPKTFKDVKQGNKSSRKGRTPECVEVEKLVKSNMSNITAPQMFLSLNSTKNQIELIANVEKRVSGLTGVMFQSNNEYNLAVQAIEVGNIKKAEEHLIKSFKYFKNEEAEYLLAYIYLYLNGDIDKAFIFANHFIKDNTKYNGEFISLICFAFIEHYYKENKFDEVIRIGKLIPSVHHKIIQEIKNVALGEAYSHKGKYLLAIEHLKQVKQNSEYYDQTLYFLGLSCYKNKEFGKAKREFAKLYVLNSNYKDVERYVKELGIA